MKIQNQILNPIHSTFNCDPKIKPFDEPIFPGPEAARIEDPKDYCGTVIKYHRNQLPLIEDYLIC